MITCNVCGNEIIPNEKWPPYKPLKRHRQTSICYSCRKQQIMKYERTLINPFKSWANNTIQNHKNRGFKILFSIHELATKAETILSCKFCGTTLEYKRTRKAKRGWDSHSPSLDVININEKELTLENTQIICTRCNIDKFWKPYKISEKISILL